ncbi:MAG: 2,3-bisphosphoglycerate-independent phosphoglycerate mutase [Clostridia bacterium]|nr:2,3-bisphosphoglycerate-independent phosphoglycerate mutase [Clostridia bacterium]MDD4047552.1 2,3-bisphosphoglycerate-independent phosphoglycerate mutase [Clostridia bacterium]
MTYKPVMLVILDGWGISQRKSGNAITLARTPFYDNLINKYPHCKLKSFGEAVGLPEGQMGNSEVGHLNIGAGRVVYQELTRINRAIRQGELVTNQVLKDAMEKAVQEKKPVHLMGLLSDGGVHSHINHLFALMEMAKAKGVGKLYIHALLDGRDVAPASAEKYITALEGKISELGLGQIATIAGRYYTMDRDKRWDRVEKGYRAMVDGEGLKARLPMEALEKAYEMKITDEFVEPTVMVDDKGEPIGKVLPGDVMIMYNFRADRARQISYAFTDKEFSGFKRSAGFPDIHYVCFTQYDVNIKAPVAFSPQDLDNTLGEVVSEAGLTQLRIAETEKYAHVTFFFNGGVEEANSREERILVSSPKVATYDLQPEMSACQVTSKVIEKINDSEYSLIVLNYANTDMVGHTGQLDACIKAVETVDTCLNQTLEAVLNKGGVVLVTADHGNAECMVDYQTQKPFTAHTSNFVPCVLVGNEMGHVLLRDGSLQDIAPTLLKLMGLKKPKEMTGESLIIGEK